MQSTDLVKPVSMHSFFMFSPIQRSLSLAFGFLASQEVKDAGVGNLGLQDRMCSSSSHQGVTDYSIERFALRWVQRYISAFGGDPTKVTM